MFRLKKRRGSAMAVMVIALVFTVSAMGLVAAEIYGSGNKIITNNSINTQARIYALSKVDYLNSINYSLLGQQACEKMTVSDNWSKDAMNPGDYFPENGQDYFCQVTVGAEKNVASGSSDTKRYCKDIVVKVFYKTEKQPRATYAYTAYRVEI